MQNQRVFQVIACKDVVGTRFLLKPTLRICGLTRPGNPPNPFPNCIAGFWTIVALVVMTSIVLTFFTGWLSS